jgi:hypothetical protein
VSDLHAVDRRHDEQRQVGGAERGSGVAGEVGVTGGVDQVDPMVVPLHDRGRQFERDLPFLLLGVWSRIEVPASTEPSREVTPARAASASASEVLPLPP